MKTIITILILLIPTIASANYEFIEFTLMLQDMWVLTEDEVFDLIFNEILWVEK